MTVDKIQELNGNRPDKMWPECTGWMDMEEGWTWDMGWMGMEATREGETAPKLDQENKEKRDYKEETGGKEQNEDKDNNSDKREGDGGNSNQATKVTKGCKKPAITNKGEHKTGTGNGREGAGFSKPHQAQTRCRKQDQDKTNDGVRREGIGDKLYGYKNRTRHQDRLRQEQTWPQERCTAQGSRTAAQSTAPGPGPGSRTKSSHWLQDGAPGPDGPTSRTTGATTPAANASGTAAPNTRPRPGSVQMSRTAGTTTATSRTSGTAGLTAGISGARTPASRAADSTEPSNRPRPGPATTSGISRETT